jgi:hypothetical protein
LIISLNTQQVYMYFRGSGKAAEMKREAARGALSSAFWWTYGSDYSQLMDRRKPDVSFWGMGSCTWLQYAYLGHGRRTADPLSALL